ncbi:MAG: ATP-binding protein [Ardenticatenaceae bacterium]|nr:ATP-binding protein [Ardenticatenaceae bacterium]
MMYTDAPPLSRKLWWGSLQLLFWLFFHPSAWRSAIHDIDSRLAPNFCLVEVDRQLWRRWDFWRLLLLSYLTWPIIVALLTALVLRLLNFPADGILLGVMVGLSAGLVASLATSLVGSLAVGTAVGIAVNLVVGIAGAFLLSPGENIAAVPFSFNQSFDLLTSTIIGLAGGLAGGLAYGAAAGVAGRVRDPEPSASLARQVSGMVIGVIVGIAAGRLTGLISGRLAAGLVVGLLFALALGWRTRRWPAGMAGGILVGMASSLMGELGGGSLGGSILVLAGFSAFLMALFVLPYTLAERMAGPAAGALAGSLGAAGGLFFFVADTNSYGPLLAFSLVGVLLGLTLAWWRPVLMYPFVIGWNNLLFRLDERRLRNGRSVLFPYHSAFWDEFQRLRLIGLDTHLLLLLHHHPDEGAAALAYVSGGPQRWAAQAAQIELDARRLEGCEGVTAVSEAHNLLGAGELAGPASALLRSFSRISQDVAAAQRQESAYNQRLALSAVEDRLDGLVRELTRSDEPYANRFRPIATQWRQLIADQVKKLADEAELRQEIDSPYIIGVPLTQQQEIFIGRSDISARIEQLLLDRRQPPLLLYGQRRVGKTSLLQNLGRLLPSTIVPLFVDLQGPASRAQDDAGFLYNVARAMIRSARQQRHLELPPLERETLAADPFTVFDEWLDELEMALGDNMALLMLDEFEVLDGALVQERFDSEAVLGMLRHLIQHRPRFKVLLSGSHTLDEFQRWSSFLINVQVIHIGYLKEEEAKQLIEAPVGEFALRYQAAASKRVLALTRGHPFLVQLLCAEVVALKNEQPPSQRRLAKVTDVETAVPAALNHGSFFFADIEQNQVDNVGREVLRLIATYDEGQPTPRQALVNYVPSLLALEQALVDLQHRELIEPLDGGYRFQVELVRRWFAERP